MRKFESHNILGVRVDNVTMSEALDWCSSVIKSGCKGYSIVVLNVAKLINARGNSLLMAAIENADLVAADGMPIVWISRIFGMPLRERVSGIDLMMRLLEKANHYAWSVFFLGATEEVNRAVANKARTEYPGLQMVGRHHGYFSREEEEGIARLIRASNPDILLIAFGTPQKEEFVGRWKSQLGAGIIHGVGGSFDVYVGLIKRAPIWMQHTGLEWLFRFLQEPKRMFWRYFRTNTSFVLLVVKAILAKLLARRDY